ncbi:MAG: HIRAN domain-containing protein [Eubacteriales bacterium]|mgnify:CR=1 FL=1|jgi:hypothetical protein
MKLGPRKPSISRKLKAKTTGAMKRKAKSTVNPLYGKKGVGKITDPKRTIYNKVYNKTSYSVFDDKGSTNSESSGCFAAVIIIALFIIILLFIISPILGLYVLLSAVIVIAIVYKKIFKPQRVAAEVDTSTTAASYQNSQNIKASAGECFSVFIEEQHLKNIHSLAYPNPIYESKPAVQGQLIFKNCFVNEPIELKPEPSNEHDPNAVAVLIDGRMVGYISEEDNTRVKYILSNQNIIRVSAFIEGGEFKLNNLTGETEISITIAIKHN